jgi:hypothetical protein
MPTLDFAVEHDYSARPEDQELAVQIRLFPTAGIPLVVTALVDTGASISLFDRSLLPLLGISDVTTGYKFEVMAANNQTADAYAHDVKIEFLGTQLLVPIGFCPTWPDGTPNLLGMKGFCDQLHLGLKHRDRLLYVAFPDK